MITSQRATLPDGRPVILTWEVSLIRLDPATQGDGWAVDEAELVRCEMGGCGFYVQAIAGFDAWLDSQRDLLDPDELASEAADDACDGPPDYDDDARERCGW